MPLTLKMRAEHAIAAVLLVLAVQHFSAAADLPAINTAPRFALVIGKGKYSEVPLKNAPNDAKAMADHLTRMGFDVTFKVDASRAGMIETIRSSVGTLAR